MHLSFRDIDLSKREEFKLLNFCRDVYLINNNLKDVDFLSTFDKLKMLTIFDNPINNLMISKDANLFRLELRNTEIKDFSFLLNKQFNSLHSLTINSKYQFDFSFLNEEIEEVNIFASNVINIESIRKLNKINMRPFLLGWYDTTNTKQNFNTLLLNLPNKYLINEIRLKANGTIDLYELCNLPNLSKLYLDCDDCDDIEGIDVFENLPSLMYLTIFTKKEFDLKYLRYSNVRELNIFCNHLKNIEYLKDIENLYEVYISAKTIEGDIDSLKKRAKFNLSIENRNIEFSNNCKVFRIKVYYKMRKRVNFKIH